MAEPRYLRDSNICTYLPQGRSTELEARMQACEAGRVVTSAIVLAEVTRGLHPGKARSQENAAAFFPSIGVHAPSLGPAVITSDGADLADIPGPGVENWTLPL